MRITDIIARKRDGAALTPEEIRFFVQSYTKGDAPDYQASALLMAIYLRGMNADETATLTAAMAESGTQLDLSRLAAKGPTLDKHSTGGVGDKTSLVVVPILAAAGAFVCKMSGRGLGHTGGTLDKLEAIPGFRIELTAEEMLSQVEKIGACLVGQTGDLAPADKKLYALRDATATVGSLPLIISSILSKKLAGGAESFLFDVKVGNGALMKTEAEARALAQGLVNGAAANGRRAVALLTDMSQPLGDKIGNALEIEEAVKTLRPLPPFLTKHSDIFPRLLRAVRAPRFRQLCLTLAAEGIELAGLALGKAALARAQSLLESGEALEIFRKIIASQGGDTSVVDDPALLPQAPVETEVTAPREGFIAAINTEELGHVVVALGGGRAHKGDTIDPSVGLTIRTEIGNHIVEGTELGDDPRTNRGRVRANRGASPRRLYYFFRTRRRPPPGDRPRFRALERSNHERAAQIPPPLSTRP